MTRRATRRAPCPRGSRTSRSRDRPRARGSGRLRTSSRRPSRRERARGRRRCAAREERDRPELVRRHGEFISRARTRSRAQRSQSGNHGAHERPHERQRPIVGDSTSTRSRATTRSAAASSSAAARSIVTPPTPGYWSANQRRMLASRPACSASSSDAPRRRAVSSRNVSCGRATRSPAMARASVASSSSAVLVDRRVDELPRVLERQPAAALGKPPLDGVRAAAGCGCSDSTASQLSCAHSRSATRCHAASAASRSARIVDAEIGRAAVGSAPRRRRGTRDGRRAARRAARAPTRRARRRRSPQPSPASTPT